MSCDDGHHRHGEDGGCDAEAGHDNRHEPPGRPATGSLIVFRQGLLPLPTKARAGRAGFCESSGQGGRRAGAMGGSQRGMRERIDKRPSAMPFGCLRSAQQAQDRNAQKQHRNGVAAIRPAGLACLDPDCGVRLHRHFAGGGIEGGTPGAAEGRTERCEGRQKRHGDQGPERGEKHGTVARSPFLPSIYPHVPHRPLRSFRSSGR